MSIRTLVLVFLALFALVAPIALAWQHALTVCPVTDAWFGVNFMNGALVYLVVEVAALTAGFLGYTALRDMECPKWMVAPILAITPNLATITANKAKEPVMTMRLFFAIILTIAIFIPMALIATFQEAFVCILGLGPLAFTAIDLILHVEYHYAVREYVAINKELRQVWELRRQLHAQFGHLSQFKHLFGPMMLCLALAGLGGCGEVKVDETDYLDSYATEAYEMNALRTAAFPHPGVGVYAPQDGMQCTGWAWQGKMYSITHCSARGNIVFNKTGENPDPVVEVNVSSIHAAPVLATDLYTVGVECSPDLRWWGATTGEWRNLDWDDIKVSGYNPNNKAAQGLLERWQLALDSASQALLRGDQAFAEMQVASAMYIKAQWEVMTTGQRYCFASGKDQVGSAGFFRQGDSGGVLLAGDEPIGSVSYSNASETENCFSATQTEKTPEVFMAKLLNIETEWKADHLNVAYEPQGLARIVFKSLTVKAEKTQIAEEANMVTVVWILILGGLLAKIFRNRNKVSMEKTFFVGDVHSRHELVAQALRMANGARIIFLGDIFDGPQGPTGAKKCLDLIRAAGAEMVLGNHELYPLFAKDKADLIRLWSSHYEVDEAMASRIWEEWMELRALLTEDDLEWLKSRPLWVKGSSEGRKWIAVHAQLPKGRLPARFVTGTPTLAQIALVDGTNTEGFWAESYAGRHGLAFIGHTRRSKLNGKCQWANVELLDWDAKKGAPGTAAIAEVTANSVIVKPVSPVGGKESTMMALIKKGLGIIALAWALVACSSTAEPVPAGMGEIVAAHNGTCSAFHWQGEIRTAAHCTYQSTDWRDNTTSVMHQVEGKYAVPEDLAEVGMECSPDLFWWGATTGKTLPVKDVRFYAVTRGTNVWDLGEEVPAWTPGAQVCFRQSLLNGFSDGDSGGPLLAGDEPIGSVSWSSSLPWGMACFGRLERTKPTWGGYVSTHSPQGGKGFRMKSIDTGSLAVTLTQVLTDLAIAGAILALAWLLARIRAKFRTHDETNAGNSAGLFGAKNPSKGHMSPILAFVARLTSVIVVLFVGVCLLAAPGVAPLVAAPAPALAAALADGASSAEIQHRLDILFGILQGLRHARRKNWNANRWRRWLRSLGLNAPKAAMPTTAKAPAKATRKGMSRRQSRARAHKAKVAATKAEAKVRRHDRKVAARMVTKAAGELALAVAFLGLIARVARHARRMEISAARSLRKQARKATAKPTAKRVVARAEGAGRPTFHPRRSKTQGYNPLAISRQEIVTRREKREERRIAREARHLNRLNGAYAALLEMVVSGTAFDAGWTFRGACMFLADNMKFVAAQSQTFEDQNPDVAVQYEAAIADIPSYIASEKKEMEYETAWAVLAGKEARAKAEFREANAKARAKRKAEREQRIAAHRAKVDAERAEREAVKAVKAEERKKRELAKAERLVEALKAREAKKNKGKTPVDVTPVSPVAKLREVRAEQANTPALAMVAGLGLASGMVAVAIIALAAIVILAVRKNRAEDTAEDTAVDADWGDLIDAPAVAPAIVEATVEAIESEPQPLLMRLIELLPAEAPAAIEAEAPALPAHYRGQAFEQLTEAEARALEDALDEPPFTDPGDWDGGHIDEEYAAQLRAGDQEAARRDAAALEEHLQILAEEAAFDEMIENGLDGVELVEKQEGEQTPEQIWASICTQLGVSTRNRSAIDAMNILIEMYQRKVDLYRFRHFGITRGYTRKQKDGSLKSGQTKTLRKDVIVRFASVLRQDKEMATWFAEASHDPSWEQFWPSIEALMKDKKQNWDAREWRTLRTRYEGAVQIVNDLCIEFLGKAKNNPNFRGGQVSCLASKDTFRYRVVDAAEAMAACKRINAVHRGGFCVARGVYQQQMQQGSHLPWVVDKLNGEGNWEEFGFVLTTTAGIADWGFGKHNRSNKSVELKTATEMLGGIVDLDHQKPERQFIEMFHKAWVSMRKPNLNDWKTFVREAAEKISPLTRSASFEVTEHEAKNGVIYSKAVTDFGTTAQTTYTFWNDGSETTCRVDSKLGATPKGFSLKFQSESRTIKKFFLKNSNYRPLKVLPWEIVPDEKELLGRYLTNSWKLTAAVEQAILRNAHHGVNYTYNELIMSIIREGFASWRELNVVTQEMSTVYHIKTRKPLTLSQFNKQNSILASLEGDYFVAETTLIPAPKPAPKSLPPIRSQYSINDDYYNSRNNPDTLIALFKRGYQWMESPSGYQLVSARKAAANPEKILKGEALATVLDAWIRATLKIQAQEGISSGSCENIADRFQMNFQSLLPGYVCSINAAEIESIALRTVKSHVNKLPDSDSPEVLAIIAEYFKQLPGHEEKLKLDREAVSAAVSVSRAARRAQLIAQGIDPDAEIPFCRAGAVLSVLALAAGLPAIAVVLPLAVTAVLAFMKMQNSDLESGEILTEEQPFCLYAGMPNKATNAHNQEVNMSNKKPLKGEVKMGTLLKSARKSSVFEKAIEDWSDLQGIALVRGKDPAPVLDDGSVYLFTYWDYAWYGEKGTLDRLGRKIAIGTNAKDSKVTAEQIAKYFGSLFASELVTIVRIGKIVNLTVKNKGLAKRFDGVVLIPERVAKRCGWKGYAVRRMLTSLGLIKGLFIILPDSFFPDDVDVITSEVKREAVLLESLDPELKLEECAVAIQPGSVGKTKKSGTFSFQPMAMLLGNEFNSEEFKGLNLEWQEAAKAQLPKNLDNLKKGSIATELEEDEDDEGEDGEKAEITESRDIALLEAVGKLGVNPMVVRHIACAQANKIAKDNDPWTLKIRPQTADRSDLWKAYPMMLPWEMLAAGWDTTPAWLNGKIEAVAALPTTDEEGNHIMWCTDIKAWSKNNSLPDYVFMARTPCGPTSGSKLRIMALPASLNPYEGGANDDEVRFFWKPTTEIWDAVLQPNEGADLDDIWNLFRGLLAMLMIRALAWRETIKVNKEDETAMSNLERVIAATVAKMVNIKEKIWEMAGVVGLMRDAGHVKVDPTTGDVSGFTPSEEPAEIYITEKDLENQGLLYKRVFEVNNAFEFSLGPVAQGQQFAMALLIGGMIQWPKIIEHLKRPFAQIVLWACMLSDVIDAKNKGKGFESAHKSLKAMYGAFTWLGLFLIARKPEDFGIQGELMHKVTRGMRQLFLEPLRWNRIKTDEGKEIKVAVMVEGRPITAVQPLLLKHPLFEGRRVYFEEIAKMTSEYATSAYSEGRHQIIERLLIQHLNSPGCIKFLSANGKTMSVLEFTARLYQKHLLATELGSLSREELYRERLGIFEVWSKSGNHNPRAIAMKMAWAREPLYAGLEALERDSLAYIQRTGFSLPAAIARHQDVLLALALQRGFSNLHNANVEISRKDNKFVVKGGIPTIAFMTGVPNRFMGIGDALIEFLRSDATVKAAETFDIQDAEKSATVTVVFSIRKEARTFHELEGTVQDCGLEICLDGMSIDEIMALPGLKLAFNAENEYGHAAQPAKLQAIAIDLDKKRTRDLANHKDEIARMNKTTDPKLIAWAQARATAVSADRAELSSETQWQNAERYDLAIPLLGCVPGTVTEWVIDTRPWTGPAAAHRTYPNQFFVCTFANPDYVPPVAEEDEEIEISVSDEEIVEEAPLTVIETPTEKAEAPADMPKSVDASKGHADVRGLRSVLDKIKKNKENAAVAAPVAPVAAPALAVPPAVVEYEGKMYAFYNVTKTGTAKLLCLDGTKYTGTPAVDKLKFLKAMPTKSFNGHEYFKNKSAGWVASCSTGNLIKDAKIVALFDENPQPTPPSKSTTLDLPNRLADKASVESKLGLPEDGASFSGQIQTPNGNLIASGYARIVYGDHGPYIEFAANQVSLTDWDIRRKGETSWYDEARLDGVMLYLQKKTVATLPNPPAGANSVRNNRPEGYADYKPGMIYVDPWKVKIVAPATPVAKEEPKLQESAPVSTLVVDKSKERCVGNFALAGLQYSDAKDIAERELVEGAEITLVRNVAHPKDANAVEVHVNGYRFGYVPKETAEKLAPRMDIGTKARATVTGWENGFVRFDLFLGKTPTTLETFNYQRDKIDDACDRLMWLEAWDATAEQKSRAEATLAHFAVLCGSLKL